MDKFYQLQGPFKNGEELVPIIKNNNTDINSIERVGIQTREGNKCRINGVLFNIGKTGLLEFDEVDITSLVFLQNESSSTLVDCVLTGGR